MGPSYYESFPIPAAEAQIATAEKRLAAQGEGVQAVVDGLAAEIGDRMGTQSAALQTVASAIKRRANAAVKANSKSVDAVVHPLLQAAAAQVTSDQIALTRALSDGNALSGTVPGSQAVSAPILATRGTLISPPVVEQPSPASPGVPSGPTPPIGDEPPVDAGSACPAGYQPATGAFSLWTNSKPGGLSCIVVNPGYCFDPTGNGGIIPNYPSVPGDWTLQSTWGDAASAYANCQSTIFPTPPTQPPTSPPTQPPATVPTYWCVRDMRDLSTHIYDQDSLPVGIGGDDNFQVSPPFNTQQEAIDYCNSLILNPAPPPEPPQPDPVLPPPPEITPECIAAGLFPNGIPQPGTEEWCRLQDQLKQFFVGVGQQILSLVDDILSARILLAPDVEQGVTPSMLDNPLRLIGYLPKLLLKEVFTLGKAIVNPFIAEIQCLIKLVSNAGWCSQTELLALSACRSALLAMSKIRLGWDAAIWATVDFDLAVQPMLRSLDYLINSACPVQIPSVGDAIDTYNRGRITLPVMQCWLAMHGYSADVMAPIIASRSHRISPREEIEYGLRTGVPVDLVDRQIQQGGFGDATQRDKLRELFYRLPGSNDFTHWLQRNVFDEDYVAEFGLLDGFEERYWARFGEAINASGWKKEYAALDYASHWILPSQGQLAEFVQRLRPGRVTPDIQFTTDDYLRLLAEQDIAPYFRERLLAVAFRPLSVSDLRNIYATRTITDEQFVQGLMDLGYAEDVARTKQSSERILAARRREAIIRGYTPGTIARLYPLGLIDDRTADGALSRQGFDGDEILRLKLVAQQQFQANVQRSSLLRQVRTTLTQVLSAYQSGAVGTDEATGVLSALGIPAAATSGLLASQELAIRAKLVVRVIGSTRRAYLQGVVNAQQALTTLVNAGIAQPRALQYMAEFDTERTVDRQRLSTERIIKLVKIGLLPLAEAKVRLKNLGWTDPDSILLLAEVEQDIANQQQKLAAAQERSRQKQAKQLEQVLKQNDAARQRIIAAIRKATPVGKLQTWYAEHIISKDYFYERLNLMQYPSEQQDQYFAEAQVKREAFDAKQAKQQASNPPAPTG